MPRRPTLPAIPLTLALLAAMAVLAAAPSMAQDLTDRNVATWQRAIETSRAAIAEDERILREYAEELRALTGGDEASATRRREIRILKQHYVADIESHKDKIAESYRKIREIERAGAPK